MHAYSDFCLASSLRIVIVIGIVLLLIAVELIGLTKLRLGVRDLPAIRIGGIDHLIVMRSNGVGAFDQLVHAN